MTRPRSLAFRLLATGLVFLGIALASIGLSLWATWQLEGGAAAVNEAGRLRMLTYRISATAAAGRVENAVEATSAFDATIEVLRSGDPSRPLFLPDSAEAHTGLARIESRWAWFKQGPAGDLRGAAALVDDIDSLVRIIEQRLTSWTTALRAFQMAMFALAVVSAVMLLYASHVLVLEPLRGLGQAIASVRAGNFGARVVPAATVELAEIAEGFNSMAGRLGAQYGELEDKVRAKTMHIEAQRERLEALYDVSSFIAKADTLEEMSKGFAGRMRRIARADAIALRWTDVRNQHYLLLAQEGLPPKFLEQEQCLPTGDCHCGQKPFPMSAKVIPIRAAQSPREHCARAGFRTLVTVPITLHNRAHGEVDLFYREELRGRDLDRSLVELLASHLAGGMEGLKATAAEMEAAISNERNLIAQELHDSIAQSLAFLKIQVQLLRSAITKDQSDAVERVVSEIETGVLESYSNVRELLMHFRTRADGEDIEPALRTTLTKFQLQTGLPTRLEMVGHGVALPADIQVQILHIIQEALSNVRKHARASSVSLKVVQAPDWQFEVTDDGIGFDATGDHDETHIGLQIMRERSRRIGGLLNLTSSREGTQVRLKLQSALCAT